MLKKMDYFPINTFVTAIIIIIVGAAVIVFILIVTIRRLVWMKKFGVKRETALIQIDWSRVQLPATMYRPILCLSVMQMSFSGVLIKTLAIVGRAKRLKEETEEQNVSSWQTWGLLKRLRLRKGVWVKCEWTNTNLAISLHIHWQGSS